jgi:hypothetical protein
MSLRTAVGQVAVVGGDPSGRPSGTLVDERASRSAKAKRRGNLYLLLELSGPVLGRDQLARQLLEAVRAAYYAWQGSVTAGLQQAIHEVNTRLFDENHDSLPGEQWAAGISCAVLREDDLFIAQAGPAAVYLTHEGQATRFPEVSPWIDDQTLEDPDAAPLGVRREVKVALYHTPVGDGDRILLVESTLLRGLHPSDLPSLLAHTPVEELPSALVAAAKGGDLSALVVAVGGEGLQAPTLGAAPVSGPAAPGRRETMSAAVAWLMPAREFLSKAGRVLLGLLGALGAGITTLLKRMLPSQAGPEPSPARPAARAGEKVRAELRKSPREERVVQPRFDSLRKLLVGLAIAIPVIVAVVVLVMVVQRNRTQKAELEALWTNASRSWEQGRAIADGATARPLLKTALGQLDELLAREPEDAAAKDLRKQVTARLDQIGQVQRVNSIHQLNSYGSGALLSRVIVQDSDVYVLDAAAGKIYHHKLDASRQALQAGTEKTVLVERGDNVGGVVVGDLVDMAWVAAGDVRPQASLVLLESNGNLLQYLPTTEQLSAQRPPGADSWQKPSRVGTYFGRYYVLDPPADKIWRYQPAADGYTTPPDDWLQAPVDLDGVVDMAIGDSIYLVYVDGKVSRLTTGVPDTYGMEDWDAPLSNPGAIFARPPDVLESVYVADRGNSRIVKTGVDGRFQGQIMMDPAAVQGTDPLSTTTSLFVNEVDGQAFVAGGNGLYVIPLP